MATLDVTNFSAGLSAASDVSTLVAVEPTPVWALPASTAAHGQMMQDNTPTLALAIFAAVALVAYRSLVARIAPAPVIVPVRRPAHAPQQTSAHGRPKTKKRRRAA